MITETSSTLMVVGGSPSNAYHDVEFVDLSGSFKQCPSVARIPELRCCSMGTFIDGKALVCAGSREIGYSQNCYSYSNEVSGKMTELEREFLPGKLIFQFPILFIVTIFCQKLGSVIISIQKY